MSRDMVYLMYHELEPLAGPPCQAAEEYRRYVVTESEFRKQMQYLKDRGWQGTCVGEALRCKDLQTVVITFDDGCETDLTVAAPVLAEAGFRATFYVVVGAIGHPGRLSLRQLRELDRRGGEIGCHSMTHPHLTELDEDQMRLEIQGAKTRLEDMLAKPVDHFSCPGGRWNRKVARIAREAGYLSVTTSRIGVNRAGADPYSLRRLRIMRWTNLAEFSELCRGRGFWRPRARELALDAAKRVLGNSRYDHVRSRLLRLRDPSALESTTSNHARVKPDS